MKVAIYSLEKILYEGKAKALNCKTEVGEITILDNHRPLISILTPGALRITDAEDKEHWFDVKGGFLEVEPGNSVRLLVENSV